MVATGQGGCIPLGIIRNETFNSTSCCCPYPSSSSSPLSPWPGSIDMLSSDWMAEGVAEVGLCLTDLTQLKPHPNLISTHQSIAETSPKHQHCLQGEISSKLCPKPILTSKPTVGRRKKSGNLHHIWMICWKRGNKFLLNKRAKLCKKYKFENSETRKKSEQLWFDNLDQPIDMAGRGY